MYAVLKTAVTLNEIVVWTHFATRTAVLRSNDERRCILCRAHASDELRVELFPFFAITDDCYSQNRYVDHEDCEKAW